jgi:diaminopimelate decarboxylase
VSLALTLAAKHYGCSAGELTIDDQSIGVLADRYGTPLYVYSSRVLARKWALLRETFPEFAISYSVKANPNRAILEYFLGQGAGLEIASAGELMLGLEAGCPPDRLLFAGPGKTEAELRLALERGVGEIHLESPREAARISAIARQLRTRARVAVRVNAGGDVQGGAMRMGGKPAPFGVDEETLDAVVDELARDPAIELRGLHLFTGTQILDHSVLARQYRKGLELARRVANRLERPLHTLDLGGGLGIPYFANETDLDMRELHSDVAALLTEARREPRLAGLRFVIEPGRYLVGEAGIYVARVNDVKASRGKTFLILDGGMNHHLAASGNLGQVLKRNFPIAILNKLEKDPSETVDIVGPLCTPLDTLAREVALPAADVGDLVGIFQSGAYGLTASPVHFLGHPSPPEILVGAGTVRLMRHRGSLGPGTANPTGPFPASVVR